MVGSSAVIVPGRAEPVAGGAVPFVVGVLGASPVQPAASSVANINEISMANGPAFLIIKFNTFHFSRLALSKKK
jgi:hypothetical protein